MDPRMGPGRSKYSFNVRGSGPVRDIYGYFGTGRTFSRRRRIGRQMEHDWRQVGPAHAWPDLEGPPEWMCHWKCSVCGGVLVARSYEEVLCAQEWVGSKGGVMRDCAMEVVKQVHGL